MYYVLYMIVLYILIYIVVLYQSPRLSDCIDWQAFRRVNSIFLSGRIGPVWPYLRKAYQLQEEVADHAKTDQVLQKARESLPNSPTKSNKTTSLLD